MNSKTKHSIVLCGNGASVSFIFDTTQQNVFNIPDEDLVTQLPLHLVSLTEYIEIPEKQKRKMISVFTGAKDGLSFNESINLCCIL